MRSEMIVQGMHIGPMYIYKICKVILLFLCFLPLVGCVSPGVQYYGVNLFAYTHPGFSEEDVLAGHTEGVTIDPDQDLMFSGPRVVGHSKDMDNRITVVGTAYYQKVNTNENIRIFDVGRVYEFDIKIMKSPLRADVAIRLWEENKSGEEIYNRKDYPLLEDTAVPLITPRLKRSGKERAEYTVLFIRVGEAK